MGCNCSKQQHDVATGNTVTRFLRRKSAVSEGTLSSTSSTAAATTTATDVSDVDEDSSKHVDAPPATEKAEAESSSVVDVEETKRNPSCSDHAVAESEDVDVVDVHAPDAPLVEHAGEATVATGSEDDVSEAKVEENVDAAEKEDANFSTKDDDGESIEKHPIDLKEVISAEGAEQAAEGVHVSDANNAKTNEQIAEGSSSVE